MSMASNTSKKTKDKKQVLQLPFLSKLSLDELASGEVTQGKFMEQSNEMDFLDILKTDYYEDNQYLYLNNKQRVNLKEVVVQIDNRDYNVETLLRVLEMCANNAQYSEYTKGEFVYLFVFLFICLLTIYLPTYLFIHFYSQKTC